jgi:hypothetical protein
MGVSDGDDGRERSLMTTKTFADHSAGYCVRRGFSLVLVSGARVRSQYKRLHKFNGWGTDMPSSPSAKPWKSRVFALSAGVWLSDLSLLFSLWVGQASAQDTSPPESKASHNDSSEVISKTSEKK